MEMLYQVVFAGYKLKSWRWSQAQIRIDVRGHRTNLKALIIHSCKTLQP